MSDWTPGHRDPFPASEDLPPAGGMVLDLSASGSILVVPEDLARAAATIARAARLVLAASERLTVAALDPRRALDPDGLATIGWTALRLAGVAQQVEGLATRTAKAALGYAGADTSGVQLAGSIGGALGDDPLLLVGALDLAAHGVAWLFAGELVASCARGEANPIGKAFDRTTGELTQDGRAALAAGFVAGALQGLLPGPHRPGVDLPATSAALRRLVGDPPPAATIEVGYVKPLPPPTGLGDVARAVKAAYCDELNVTCTATADGVVAIQRLDHGPGKPPSWLVAIPGTQSPAFGGRSVTDMTTNLALDGGQPDQMSAGVLKAMREAGIGRDDAVLVAGHSQGGMTAQEVAVQAGISHEFSIRAVVVIGSPNIPATPNVPIISISEHEDAITGVDGAPGARLGPQDLVVNGDLSSVMGDVPGPVAAHNQDSYAALADRADADLARRGLRVPGVGNMFEHVVGTTTRSFQVTRDPAAVAASTW